MWPSTLQYPPTFQFVLGRPSHLRPCPPPLYLQPPLPFPSFLPSFLPSLLLGLHGHPQPSPRADTHTHSDLFFPSLLRDYSRTFPNLPRARQPAYDTRPKECKLPLPFPLLPPHTHTPGRSPGHLKALATKTDPQACQAKPDSTKAAGQNTPDATRENQVFYTRRCGLVLLEQTFGPRPGPGKMSAGRASATTTKTNSHQDRKEPCAEKSCVGRKLKFLKKGVAQAQAARAGGYMHTFLFCLKRLPRKFQKSCQKSRAQWSYRV